MDRRAVTHRLAIGLFAAVLVGGCAAAKATPPPPEPHTGFNPVEVKVDSDLDWLAAGFDSVWLKRPEGFVDRIDAATGKVLAKIQLQPEALPEACEGIGRGSTGIWSCAIHDVVRIDPASNEIVTSVPVGKVQGQGRMVSAGGRIWVLTGDGDRLVGIAEADGSPSEPIVLPAACHDLGATADIVYVVCERAGRVLRVDPAPAKVTADVTIAEPAWVSAAASGVWVSAGQNLLRLDPVTLMTAITVEGLGTGSLGAIHADDGGVWVRKVNPFITRVDAGGSIKRVITGPYPTGGDLVADGKYLWATEFDSRLVIRLDLPADH